MVYTIFFLSQYFFAAHFSARVFSQIEKGLEVPYLIRLFFLYYCEKKNPM